MPVSAELPALAESCQLSVVCGELARLAAFVTMDFLPAGIRRISFRTLKSNDFSLPLLLTPDA
jgi:hypothetical protein